MLFVLHLLLLALSAECSLRPGSAVFGVLQTPKPSKTATSYQFAGFYVPESGIYWKANRRSVLQGLGDTVRYLRDVLRFRDAQPLTDDSPKEYMYRIFIVNRLNAIKNAAKRGIVSLDLLGDKLIVKRNGFLRKVANNRY